MHAYVHTHTNTYAQADGADEIDVVVMLNALKTAKIGAHTVSLSQNKTGIVYLFV